MVELLRKLQSLTQFTANQLHVVYTFMASCRFVALIKIGGAHQWTIVFFHTPIEDGVHIMNVVLPIYLSIVSRCMLVMNQAIKLFKDMMKRNARMEYYNTMVDALLRSCFESRHVPPTSQ